MESGRHQDDPARRARLSWRSRRGLLENDLILTRFLDLHEATLSVPSASFRVVAAVAFAIFTLKFDSHAQWF
jgi:hypothetical protein